MDEQELTCEGKRKKQKKEKIPGMIRGSEA